LVPWVGIGEMPLIGKEGTLHGRKGAASKGNFQVSLIECKSSPSNALTSSGEKGVRRAVKDFRSKQIADPSGGGKKNTDQGTEVG